MNFLRGPLALPAALIAAALVASCAGPPVTPGGFVVTASVSAATLADDCPSAEPTAPGAPRAEADCAAGFAGCGYCRQSNMQLQLGATAGEGAAVIEVVAVRLIDAETNTVLETLTSRSPQQWDGSAYVAWDQRLAAGSNVQASYDLSAPNWASHAGADGRLAYSRRYLIEVVLRVDGAERTIRSGELTREPEVVT